MISRMSFDRATLTTLTGTNMEYAIPVGVVGPQDERRWLGWLPALWRKRSWISMGLPCWVTLWPWVAFLLKTWILVRFLKTLFSVQIPKQSHE